MKISLKASFSLSLAFIALSLSFYCAADRPTLSADHHPNALPLPSKPFIKLDATRFQKPYPDFGEKITVIYENQVLGSFENYNRPPEENQVKQRLQKYAGQPRVVLDIESWSISHNQKIDPNAAKHASWYLAVLHWAREVLPGTDIGYFGLPLSPWFTIKNPAAFARDYQAMLELLMPVLRESDTLYPEFYIYYNDPENLINTMSRQIKLARDLDKPVLPFLWHRGPGSIFKNQLIPRSLLQQQCEFVKRYADGWVWWSISSESWDKNAWDKVIKNCFE